MSLTTVMRYVEPPHIILRKSLIAKERVSSFAADVGRFMAQTLFGSSGLALDGGTLRTRISKWSLNTALCALTEKVIFTDPYTADPFNHHTAPHLDAYAAGIRNDSKLKLAAAYHKSLFLTSTQALLHGDLHTGSVMVKQGSTFVIDPEFAFYGPVGFDVGAFLSNLFLAYFSFFGRDADYAEWILSQVVVVSETFLGTFAALWTEHSAKEAAVGEIYKPSIYTAELLQQAQRSFLQGVWRDSLGFAGMKMVRRIVGIAHVADLETIEDFDVRAPCEKRALLFARTLILASFENSLEAGGLSTAQGVNDLARRVFAAEPTESWPAQN